MKRDKGIFPRGIFVWPPDRDLADVELVILGENPGRAPAVERALYTLLNERYPWESSSTDAIRKLSTLISVDDWEHGGSYWRNALLLARALYPAAQQGPPSGFQCTVAGMEIAYCQSPDPKPGWKHHWPALTACAKRHLADHMAATRKEAIVMCLGGAARYFMDQHGGGRRWFSVDHLSGSWGSLFRLIQPQPSRKESKAAKDAWVPELWPCVEAEWQSVLAGGSPRKLGAHHGTRASQCDLNGCGWKRTRNDSSPDEAPDSVAT